MKFEGSINNFKGIIWSFVKINAFLHYAFFSLYKSEQSNWCMFIIVSPQHRVLLPSTAEENGWVGRRCELCNRSGWKGWNAGGLYWHAGKTGGCIYSEMCKVYNELDICIKWNQYRNVTWWFCSVFSFK